MAFKAAFFISGRDGHGRPLAHLVHEHHRGDDERHDGDPSPLPTLASVFLDPEYVPDEEDDGYVPFRRRMVVSGEAYPLPATEIHPSEINRYAEKPRSLTAMPAPPALPALQDGDLLVAEEADGYPDDLSDSAVMDVLRLSGVRVIANGLTPEQAVALVPTLPEYQPSGFSRLLLPIDVCHTSYVERRRREADECLFLVTRDGGPEADAEACILMSTGSYFFHDGEIDSGLYEDLAPGVYALLDGQPWSDKSWTDCGWEYDGGINGTPVPATIEHLERFGFTPESLIHELRHVAFDYLDQSEDPIDQLVEQGGGRPAWAPAAAPAP